MTRIFGTNSGVGDWMMSPFTNGDAERMSKVNESVTADKIVEARAEIERCAQAGETFYYGSETPESVKRGLVEYAEAVGLPSDSVAQVDSDTIRTSRGVVDTLSAVADAAEPAAEQIFDIMPTQSTDPDAFAKDGSWETSKAAQLMNYRPDVEGVVPIRGGDEYDLNPVKGVRDGENSIADPDAIETSAQAEGKSSVDLIREGNESRKNASIFDSDAWESGMSAEMDDTIVPDGGYRMVESPQSQNHSSTGSYRETIAADPDSAPVPDRTAGEQIPELNQLRACEITRETEIDDWEKLESSVGNTVTDLFFDNLQKNLEQINQDPTE